jgi:hypothetical protein
MLARADPISMWWGHEGWFRSKPVLTFWLEALCMRALGVNAAPSRGRSAMPGLNGPCACQGRCLLLAWATPEDAVFSGPPLRFGRRSVALQPRWLLARRLPAQLEGRELQHRQSPGHLREERRPLPALYRQTPRAEPRAVCRAGDAASAHLARGARRGGECRRADRTGRERQDLPRARTVLSRVAARRRPCVARWEACGGPGVSEPRTRSRPGCALDAPWGGLFFRLAPGILNGRWRIPR